ncbi:MAG: putative Ig domain-containing protein [Hyalangium sp.]|uniref:putative Ig domain-containing protein n=1 Tax=Hyalangium sp. TaxID=2028555 RepID=UPI003899DC5A
MRSSHLIAGLLATALALSACKSESPPPPPPPAAGAPTVSDTTLAETTVSASYASSVSASGGTAPYTFSAQGLPPGISLASDSGVLSGMAAAAGDFQVQVTVKDASGQQASKAFPLKVYPPVSFTLSALPAATAEFAYSATLGLEGGKAPLTMRLAGGELPTGVNFNPNSKLLAGTFPLAGTFALIFEATDVNGAKATQSYVLTVAGPLHVTLSSLPAGNVGSAYSQIITTSGGRAPITASLENGTLPPGLSFSGTTLSGTPTTAGHFTFGIKVTDANGITASLATAMDIFGYPPPSIVTTGYKDGYAGDPYSAPSAASGGKGALTWSLASGALPDGLAINATTGQLTGTPTQTGTFSFTVRVSDTNNQEATQPLQVVIYTLPTLTSASPLPSAYAGQPYTANLTATGGKGTLTFSPASGALPQGLSLSASGAIGTTVSASVPHATQSTFTVTVTDANSKSVSKTFQITTYQPPQILSTTLTAATEGVAYRRSEASLESLQAQYGQGQLTFSATGLPQGLSLNASTGELGGTPAQGSAGSYPVTFTTTDAGNQSTSKQLTLQVVKPQPTNYGGTVGLAPAGSRITDTLTVFIVNGRFPAATVGVRVRKNGQEYTPAKEALTDAAGKVVFTGLGLNGTTDTVDITANGKDLTNTTLAGINASVVTLQVYSDPLPGWRASSSGAYDPSTRRFLVYGGYDSSGTDSLFYTPCFNDTVEAVDVTKKSFVTRVQAGLTTSPSPRYDAAMATAGGSAVLFGGRRCTDSGDSLGDTWEFNLSTNAWTAITPSGAKPAPRRAPAMVRDATGNFIYMLGGYRNPFYSNELWRYDPSAHTWSQLASAPFTRAWMGSTLQTVTGELWFCGGRGSATTTQCQSFNPSNGTWTVQPSLPTARSEFGMAFDPYTETLYAFGGRAADGTPYGDLLRLRKGTTTWESVIPTGATPLARSGHVMYFDLTRHELVVALGLNRDPVTFRTTRLADLWTYDGQSWTERAPAAARPGYSASGQVTGGPVNGSAVITLSTPTGFFGSASVTLDAQGRGTYTLSAIPPAEPLLMTVLGEDTTQSYPSYLWNYTEVQHAGLAADATVNIALPPGPAVLLQATGSYQLPASWHNQAYYLQGEAYVDAPGFPFLTNGVANYDGVTNQFDLAFAATAAPEQQRLNGYLASELLCEDHSLYTPIGSGTLSIPLNPSASGVSPGQPECTPQGPRGVGQARIRASSSGAQRVVVADLDGDTLPELIIPQPVFSGVGILWGTPSVASAFTDFGCCDTGPTHSVVAGDFNKDGRMDLAATEPGTNSVKIMLAQASPARSFAPSTSYTVGTSPSGLAVADVNGDGFKDLLVANQGDNTVSILYGGTNGTFTTGPVVTLAGTSPTQVLVTNVDGDSQLDLVVLVSEGISLALDGFTQGPFGNSTLITAGSQPSAVVVGRLNGDTLPDMAVANAGSNNVSILLGAGSGSFAQPVNLAVGQAPAGLVLAELTGDTHLDLAVTSSTNGTVTLYQGASDGTFVQHSKVPVAGDPRGLAVVDFNGDGLNDLAVASPTASGVYLLLGQKPAPAASGNLFSFTAPAKSGFMWSMHGIEGHRRYWDYYAPIQPGPVSYSLPLPSTLAPSSAPVAPTNGKLELTWTPWVKQWEPNSPRLFNPRQFYQLNLGTDAETQPGASHYFWP